MASLFLNSLFKDQDTICKYGHILEERGLRLPHMSLGVTNESRSPSETAHRWGPPTALCHQAQNAPQGLSTFLPDPKEQGITRPQGKAAARGQVLKQTCKLTPRLGRGDHGPHAGRIPRNPESVEGRCRSSQNRRHMQKRNTPGQEKALRSPENGNCDILREESSDQISPPKLDEKTKKQKYERNRKVRGSIEEA